TPKNSGVIRWKSVPGPAKCCPSAKDRRRLLSPLVQFWNTSRSQQSNSRLKGLREKVILRNTYLNECEVCVDTYHVFRRICVFALLNVVAVSATDDNVLSIWVRAASTTAPITGAVVSAKPQSGDPVDSIVVGDHFEIRRIAAGAYFVKAKAPGYKLNEVSFSV